MLVFPSGAYLSNQGRSEHQYSSDFNYVCPAVKSSLTKDYEVKGQKFNLNDSYLACLAAITREITTGYS